MGNDLINLPVLFCKKNMFFKTVFTLIMLRLTCVSSEEIWFSWTYFFFVENMWLVQNQFTVTLRVILFCCDYFKTSIQNSKYFLLTVGYFCIKRVGPLGPSLVSVLFERKPFDVGRIADENKTLSLDFYFAIEMLLWLVLL